MDLKLIKEAVQLAELNAKLFETKTALEIKLNLIKEAIELGEYQINAHYIARKLVEFNSESVLSELA